ncbi:MAG: hypothetical protein DWQ36_18835 [Acidobacteria bacterium]|nr:MAG: hypothetical protein DWQ30_03605 [Acidobacteriota bacterium]REK03830.1 MAG: hypothetical protein DWQ36_18835 [Acidobacteriota bacterium]
MRLRSALCLAAAVLLGLALLAAAVPTANHETATATVGTPSSDAGATAAPRSLSALAFGPDGTLYIGDSRGGAVFAVTTEEPARHEPTAFEVVDLEAKIAARLGTSPGEIMLHDLAVHPSSNRVFLAVSRGRAGWTNAWQLPNHVADADILLTVDPGGAITEYPLSGADLARVALPSPVSEEKKHAWMQELSLRTDTITDLAVSGKTLYVAGLSNEEFSSALWKISLPLGTAASTSVTTVEVYHGAHGEYETHAPIRTFVPLEIDGEERILAAYLCTPLALFDADALRDESHVKGRTIAELGAGNYPLDMVRIQGPGGDRIAMANSSLPLMIIETAAIAAFDGSITEKVPGYTAGVEHVRRSPTGIQQLDKMGDAFLLTVQRMPSGTLNLATLPLRRG